jgi:hypothetical protein
MVGGYGHVNMEITRDYCATCMGPEHAQHTWGAPARHPFRILAVAHSCPVLKLYARSSISECYKIDKACERSYLEGNFHNILEAFTKLRLLISRCKPPEGHAGKDCTLFRVHL